jgi:hypothetical protein
MRKALLLAAAMLLDAELRAADGGGEDQIEVRLSVYFDLSGEGQAYVMKLGNEPRTFTFKIEDIERLSLKMIPIGDCRVSVEILGRDSVTMTRPLTWPAFFEPGATFAVGVYFPHHRQEVRGSVSGTGACSRTAPNKLLEPTLKTNAA